MYAPDDRCTADDFMRCHRGATLLELIVVLAILGITTVVAVVTLDRPYTSSPETVQDSVADARGRAVISGTAVTIIITDKGIATHVTAYPDGRVSGAEHVGISPLTGLAIRNSARD